MRKVYLAAPFTHNFETDFLIGMEKWLLHRGYSIIIPHNFASNNASKFKEEGQMAFSSIDKCDILLADVSKPSHGVGMEILHAFRNGKKVILVMASGTKLSGLAHAHGHEIIEYDDLEDLKTKLERIL